MYYLMPINMFFIVKNHWHPYFMDNPRNKGDIMHYKVSHIWRILTSCNPVKDNQCFRGIYHLYLQGWRQDQARNLKNMNWIHNYTHCCIPKDITVYSLQGKDVKYYIFHIYAACIMSKKRFCVLVFIEICDLQHFFSMW
jgi:hypothetical protein